MAAAARTWSMGVSLLAHLLPLALLLRAEAPDPGAKDIGTGGIEVALGPAGGSPGSLTPVEPFEKVRAVDAEPVEAEPAPTSETMTASVPPPEAMPQALETLETIVAVSEPSAEVETRAAPVATPAPRPRLRPRVAPRPVPLESGAQRRGGSGVTAAAGTAESSSSGGGIVSAPADYLTALQAWLERHKEYPRQARLRRQEGTVLLSFTFDRGGRVLDHHIARSSGHEVLDREVAAMLTRAQPLPPLPEAMNQARLQVTVPVVFALR